MITSRHAFDYEGKEVKLFTLDNGKIKAEILNFGGIVRSLILNGAKDVVLGYDDLTDYVKDTKTYFGAVVGRVANRIKGAQFRLNGKTYKLFKNDGENSLHGGENGFSRKIWSAKTEGEKLVLSYFSPDGEEGYPSDLDITVIYSLENYSLNIEYFAESNGDTPVSLTNHTYFNLGKSVKETEFFIDADKFTAVDKNLIPTGLKSVEKTPFDLREFKKAKDGLDSSDEQITVCGGYDVNFCLNGKGFRKVAAVKSDDVLMEVYTDRDGLQFYSGNFLSQSGGKNGAVYGKNAGFCLETQSYPDAVNNKDFPSVILKKGQKYASKTAYVFSEINEKI